MSMIKYFLHLQLRTKLLILTAILTIFPVLAVGFFLYQFTSSMIQEEISAGELDRLTQVNNHLTYFMQDIEQLSMFFYRNEQIQNILRKDGDRGFEEEYADFQEVHRIIEMVLGVKDWDVSIYVIGLNGDRYFNNPYLPSQYDNIRENWGVFRQANETKGEMVWNTHYSLRQVDSQEIVLTSGRVLIDEATSEPLGYIMIDIYESALSSIYSSETASQTEQLFLLDENGYIISSKPDKDDIGTRLPYDFLPRVLNGEQGFFEFEWEGQPSILTYDTAEDTGVKIVSITPLTVIQEKNSLIYNLTWSFAFIVLIIAVWIAYYISSTVTRPLYKIMNVMGEVETGNLSIQFEPKYNDDIGVLGRRFNRMLKRLKALITDSYEKQVRLKESEIKALQAQINPHFMYNTLETINWMARLSGKMEISKLVVSLGEIMRYSIKTGDDLVTLEEDVKQLRNYLTIQQVRYRDQFDIHLTIADETKQILIPSLLLQPLVENAIHHGLEKKVDPGNLWVSAKQEGVDVIISVEDDGAGMASSILYELNHNRFDQLEFKGTGIGLENVRRRLYLYYGDEHEWHIESEESKGTKITMTIPVRKR